MAQNHPAMEMFLNQPESLTMTLKVWKSCFVLFLYLRSIVFVVTSVVVMYQSPFSPVCSQAAGNINGVDE